MSIEAARRSQKSLSIRSKLFLLRIGIGLLMGVAIGMLSFWVAANILQKQHNNDLVKEARLIGAQVNSVIQQLGDHLRSAAQSDEMAKYQQAGQTALLVALFSSHLKLFDKISYINANGIPEATVVHGNLVPEETFSERSPAYQSALQNPNTLIVDGPEVDATLRQPVLRLWYQHIDFFDNSLGTLQATVSLAVMAEQLQNMLKQESQSIIITDTSGRIIYGPSTQNLGEPGRSIASSSLFRNTSQQSAYLGKHTVYGIPSLASVHHLPQTAWNVFVLKPTDSFHKPLYRLCLWIVLVTFVTIGCGEILSRLLGIRILEPITRLRQVTSAILADGELDKRVEWTSHDEIGELSDTFNAMLEKIHKTQNQFQEERQFVENIIQSMTDLLIVVTPSWDILKINSHVCRLFIYEEGEMAGRHIRLLLPASDGKLLSAAEEQTLAADGTVLLSQKNLVSKVRESIPLSLRVSQLISHLQEPLGYLITGRDIRQKLKIKEERRQASEKLREAKEELLKTEKLAIVGQMSGMVAHEVLNPVSAMYARLDLNIKEAKESEKIPALLQEIVADWQLKADQNQLEAYIADKGRNDIQLLQKIGDAISKKEAERLENLNFLYKLTRRVIRIIDNLREMSRRKRTMEEVSLTKLINEAVEDMGDGLRKRNIAVEKAFASHPVFRADYMEVYSIISNLLKNAVQAIDANPEVKDKKIAIRVWRNGAMASVRIKDSGIGMDRETEGRLFDTGFSSKGREGTGLGLSYSRKIARQMGGDLFLVNTAVGQGAEFQINFNYQRCEDEKRAA